MFNKLMLLFLVVFIGSYSLAKDGKSRSKGKVTHESMGEMGASVADLPYRWICVARRKSFESPEMDGLEVTHFGRIGEDCSKAIAGALAALGEKTGKWINGRSDAPVERDKADFHCRKEEFLDECKN